MRWILVEIRPADPKFFFVRVDPFPQDFTPRASLGTRIALHAHEVGRKPMDRRVAAAFTGALDPFFVVGGLLLYLLKSPRQKTLV